MNSIDFSNRFDTQLNSYAVQAGFGKSDGSANFTVDEYEKSIFLTQSQEQLVIALYSGKNPYTESFEETEEMRRYLSPLVEEVTLSPIAYAEDDIKRVDVKKGDYSALFKLPNGVLENVHTPVKPKVWFITYEGAKATEAKTCNPSGLMDVYPVRQDEYHKIKRNPFRGTNERRTLRLDLGNDVIEVVSKYELSGYYIKYLRRPKPIIVGNIDNININGYFWGGLNTPANPAAIEYNKVYGDNVCELHEALHQRILDGAVLLALQSKGYRKNSENR